MKQAKIRKIEISGELYRRDGLFLVSVIAERFPDNAIRVVEEYSLPLDLFTLYYYHDSFSPVTEYLGVPEFMLAFSEDGGIEMFEYISPQLHDKMSRLN